MKGAQCTSVEVRGMSCGNTSSKGEGWGRYSGSLNEQVSTAHLCKLSVIHGYAGKECQNQLILPWISSPKASARTLGIAQIETEKIGTMEKIRRKNKFCPEKKKESDDSNWWSRIGVCRLRLLVSAKWFSFWLSKVINLWTETKQEINEVLPSPKKNLTVILMGPGLYLKVEEKIGLLDAVIELSPNNNTLKSAAAINLRSGCSAVELCVLSLLIQKDYMDYKTELLLLGFLSGDQARLFLMPQKCSLLPST